MDTHLHYLKCALLAKSWYSDIEELLIWLKVKLSATVSLCTVTFINFRWRCVVGDVDLSQTMAVEVVST